MPARPRRLGRFAALFLAAAAIMSLLPEAALAASRACRQLEAELATASGGGRPAARSPRQEAAIARQREQLQAAKRQARSAGCGFKLFGGGSNSCGAINAKIAKMERNLDALQRRRSNAAGSGRSHKQIMAALRANGCRDEAVAGRQPARQDEGTRNLFDKLFGGGIRQRGSIEELGEPVRRSDENRDARRASREPEGGWVNDNGRIRYSAPRGSYRTLCVRTCDGYYFPMSSSSSPSDFERDQANCQTSCPGTEVQIYYHRKELESEAMVSGLSGQPYADLPTAWLYKQPDAPSPAGCTCGAVRNAGPKNFSIVAGNPPPAPVQSGPLTPHPRPDPAADPETLANSHGGLDAETLRRMAVAPKSGKTPAPGEEKKIRVVGPGFLPDPEAAADPQAPGQNPIR